MEQVVLEKILRFIVSDHSDQRETLIINEIILYTLVFGGNKPSMHFCLLIDGPLRSSILTEYFGP